MDIAVLDYTNLGKDLVLRNIIDLVQSRLTKRLEVLFMLKDEA